MKKVYKEIKIPLFLNLLRQLDFPHKKGILHRLYGSYLSKQGIGWVKTWNGIPWLIDGRTHCHQWMVYDRYADGLFLKWAEKNVPSNGVILDSGSNIGQFLPYFSKLVPKGKVIGFEPSFPLFQWIQKSIDHAALTNIEVLNFGLGNHFGKVQLKLPSDESVHGLWAKIVEDDGDETISITRVEEELRSRNIEEVALWKLDVEGYEVPALTGAASLLISKNLKAAYIELCPHDDNHKKIVAYMQQFDYSPYLFTKNGLKPMKEYSDIENVDALFLPN